MTTLKFFINKESYTTLGIYIIMNSKIKRPKIGRNGKNFKKNYESILK